MKKILFIVILMLCLSLVLISCKKDDAPQADSSATTESTQSTATPPQEKPTDGGEGTPSQGETTEAPYVQNPEVNSSPYGDGDQGIGSEWSENY